MSIDETEIPGDDILSQLKEDGRAAAPMAARERVFSRLGVGVAAGVAVVTHAVATSAAVGKAAGSAPVAGGVLGFGAVKALVANPIVGVVATLAVGSGVGLGAYEAFQADRVPAPVVAKPSVPAAKPAEPASAAMAAPPPPSGPTQAEIAVPAAPEPGTRPPVAPPIVTSAPASLAELVPAPALPADPKKARLAEQQTLLDQARAALRRGDGAGALAIVSGHEKLYPATAFAEEREAIGVLALTMSGRADEARARGEQFEKRFPSSFFLPSIRKALAPNGPVTREQAASENSEKE